MACDFLFLPFFGLKLFAPMLLLLPTLLLPHMDKQVVFFFLFVLYYVLLYEA